jgi:hypothetical protein
MFTKRNVKDIYVPIVCVISPAICTFLYFSSKNKAMWRGGYQIGAELLIINGLLTFLGLFILSQKPK